MPDRSSGPSRDQRWVIAVIALPFIFLAAWVLVGLVAFVLPLPAIWTHGQQPTFGEWVIRALFLAAPFVITAVAGWRLYRWIMRGARRSV